LKLELQDTPEARTSGYCMLPLLQINDLQIEFPGKDGTAKAVYNSNFSIMPGRLTAIVGESGSGKSVTALSLLQLLPKQTVIKGEILFSEDEKRSQDLAKLSEKEIRDIRGNKIAMIFQEPMTSLNPVYTCGDQVMESLVKHKKISKASAKNQVLALFVQVALPKPAEIFNRYPHQLSGGQKQRVMIAMAMSCDPAILVADEPTTALDVRVQKNILQLIKGLQEQNNMAVLLITHDLALVADMADEVIVMYKGQIVEQGTAKEVLQSPRHAYTKALLACRPGAGSKGKRLPVISDFIDRENIHDVVDNNTSNGIKDVQEILSEDTHNGDSISLMEKQAILSVENLTVCFPDKRNIFGKTVSVIPIVKNVSFEVMKNETVGLVGESGCGKTTLGRAILQLIKPSSGKIVLEGTDLTTLNSEQLRLIRKNLQIVFQDPYGSLNPRMTIADAILEPLNVHQIHYSKKQRKEQVVELLEKVSLQGDHFNRYPHQFSGGQRQRICIARALALQPDFLIFDESVSALDVSVQAQVLNLINDLKAEMNFSSIFISHDLSVVHYISDRILVMNKGRIVEEGSADDIYFNPSNDYTQQLVQAIPGKGLF